MSGSRNLKGLRVLIQIEMLENQLTLGHLKSRQVVPVDYFINNDLEYLRRGSLSKKYTTSTTKTKASKYDIPGIEDKVPSLWSPVKVAYDRYDVWGISHWVLNDNDSMDSQAT
nr:hypothetical protein [Tanacetum cinerariifolium]